MRRRPEACSGPRTTASTWSGAGSRLLPIIRLLAREPVVRLVFLYVGPPVFDENPLCLPIIDYVDAVILPKRIVIGQVEPVVVYALVGGIDPCDVDVRTVGRGDKQVDRELLRCVRLKRRIGADGEVNGSPLVSPYRPSDLVSFVPVSGARPLPGHKDRYIVH